MTPRDFICTPSSWLTDARLNALSDDAELLFRRLAACTDKNWRFPFDHTALEHTIRTAAFSPQRRFRAWNPDRIRRGLNELTAAGMLTRHYQGDRHWIEVAEPYRYVKGRDAFAVDGPPQQPDLPDMAPGLFALPSPDALSGTKPTPPLSSAGGGIGKRTESEQKRTETESDARSTSPEEQRPTIRATCREDDSDKRVSGKFAAGAVDFPNDSEWSQICLVLGADMVANGSLWVKRWKTNRDACVAGMRDWQAKTPQERAQKGNNPAAFITTAFTNATQRRAS